MFCPEEEAANMVNAQIWNNSRSFISIVLSDQPILNIVHFDENLLPDGCRYSMIFLFESHKFFGQWDQHLFKNGD